MFNLPFYTDTLGHNYSLCLLYLLYLLVRKSAYYNTIYILGDVEVHSSVFAWYVLPGETCSHPSPGPFTVSTMLGERVRPLMR